MYKMLTVESVVLLNKELSNGNLVNRSSLEFALSSANKTKDWITQLAYIIRAIALDHVFEEGNKRTSVAVMIAYIKAHKKGYDIDKLDRIIVRIITRKINDIAKIRRLIKDAIW